MSGRISSAVMFILLLTSIMTTALSIRPVKAQEPICINDDGSVDPPDAPIFSNDNVTYTVDGDIAREVVIGKSSIVLDGEGHVLQGSQYLTTGIRLASVENVTVRNINIMQFTYGIYLDSSSNNTISNNTIMANQIGFKYGIYLHSSSGNAISNNTVTATRYGIRLDSSFDNKLLGNKATGNTANGIFLYSSFNNNVSVNNVAENLDGICLENSERNTLLQNTAVGNSGNGISLESSHNNTLQDNDASNNAANGIFLHSSFNNNMSENDVAGNGMNSLYGIYLQNSDHNEVLNNTATGNMMGGICLYVSSINNVSGNIVTGIGGYAQYDGIKIESSKSNNVSGNKITANSHNGINICARTQQSGSVNNTVHANQIGDNSEDGIFVDVKSCNNTIRQNNIIANGAHASSHEHANGIFIESSSNTVCENNIAANNGSGVYLYSASSSGNMIYGNNITTNTVYGFFLSSSSNNMIYGNNITNNGNIGLWLIRQSHANVICGNNILDNSYGIGLDRSDNNKVYHNCFNGSLPLVWGVTNSMNTAWDDGDPNGGNYWSNYDGNDTDNDGIGDTPYRIDDSNVDDYPLMSAHYVVTDISCFRTVVGQGYCINISITVSNCGTYNEDVNLTLCANATLIDQTDIALVPSQALARAFSWNTSGCDFGNYRLIAYASPASEETSLIGHNCIDGYVMITKVGDITGQDGYPDGVCNMQDIAWISNAFGAQDINATDGWYWHYPNPCHNCGTHGHNPNCDINNDGVINMKDISRAAKNFGDP